MKLFLPAIILAATLAASQTTHPALKAGPPKSADTGSSTSSQEQARRKFVLDVVHSAVGLNEPDPQDRLRVLYAAANVVAPLDNNKAQQLAKEGTTIETKLVAEGQRPAVSMLAGGHVGCATAVTYVQTIPPAAVLDAEPSLVAAITSCPAQVNEAAKRKLEAGLDQGTLAARAILALMDTEGMKTTWSQAMFGKMYSALPADATTYLNDAPNYAAMFARAAPAMSPDAVKSAGSKLMLWLAKLPDSPQRSVAVNLTTGSLSDKLGKDAYQELLRSDVMIQQLANSAQQNATVPAPDEERVSVLKAMGSSSDRTDALNGMSPSLRAREAAASGFASGTSGDRKMADHYFDIAFSSVDEVWSSRTDSKTDAPAVVEEVSEAAAQIDPVAALQRSERLQDPSAEAISMLAVARVMVGKE